MSVEGEEIELSPEELLVEPTEREGYALERDGGLSVALRTELDPELVDEGLVRELVHKVQNLRREKGFEIEESVAVGLSGSREDPDPARGNVGATTSGPRCWPASSTSTRATRTAT